MKTMTVEILVRRLSYLGMVPYVLLAALVWLVPADLHPFIAIALVGFAAVNAAFLGGIHWGIGLRPNAPYGFWHVGWGIAPALVAWVAVVMPAYAGLPLLALLLLACCVVDHKTWPRAGLTAWLPMRLHTTVVAVLACLLGAAGT
ncbi:DUF3429 domain-containing protein [Rhodoferax sp.]|uniref:DUF3429 domain-containing protein n=1 Tax=Rhodoferax sp. TaxID=50421 RepID=UPI00374CCCF6